MSTRLKFVAACVWVALIAPGLMAQAPSAPGAAASFRGSLPPPPTSRPSAAEIQALQADLKPMEEALASLQAKPYSADVAVLLKALRYAVDFEEWFDKKPADSLRKAKALMDEARSRLAALKEGRAPWMDRPGYKLLGFYSRIDGSAQPYGVEVPEDGLLPKGKPAMMIWLHGRGDTATDLNFVYGRLTARKPNQIRPKGALIVHPFGRFCNGWKSAGETDVFECRDDAAKRFGTDERRVALAGFSMGGAGAWHLGAHFADQWACVHPGAGFADVKFYQKLKPEQYPPAYEQALWNLYDVPAYARNFLNLPLVLYSGENDAQRATADSMQGILKAEGMDPPHFIGPGVGHQYHKDSIPQVTAFIEEALARGRPAWPERVVLQTRCLLYNRCHWLSIGRLSQHWLQDARLEARRDEQARRFEVKAQGVELFALQRRANERDFEVRINGQRVEGLGEHGYLQVAGRWVAADATQAKALEFKAWQASGPVDLLFHEPFVLVLPDRAGFSPKLDAWVAQESAAFVRRWQRLMRGRPRVVKASEYDPAMTARSIFWGDLKSNSALAALAAKLPLAWDAKKLTVAGQVHEAAHCAPVGIFSWVDEVSGRRLQAGLNAGLSFREAHDRTNSLQNPKLPDLSVLDLDQPADAQSAGRVLQAEFYDEQWRLPKGR